MWNPKLLIVVGAIALGLLWLSTQFGGENRPGPGGLVDDWQYRSVDDQDGGFMNSGGTTGIYQMNSAAPAPMTKSAAEASAIGFSVGGAKDINNFRENILENFLPLISDITYEGLFYHYYFDTAMSGACERLFCPSYSYALSKDPFSSAQELYLAVGLNSGLTEADFARKKLNLVVVLDVSGSMGSPFNAYYYDRFGNQQQGEADEPGEAQSKMQVAAESLVALLGHLRPDDRLGVVLFNGSAHLGKPLSLVGETDMQAVEDHILEIAAGGGTQMSAGMEMATGLFDERGDVDPEEYENRVIFLTDAMPNLGETSEHSLFGLTEENARNRVYSTFIGIGVDFNTELVEKITKIKGANYYSVHSAKEFAERMDEGFEFMVTPLVFDLTLSLEADGYRIEKVYGSPEADEATGELMRVNTLFPSKTEGGKTKGGLVLLKLRRLEGAEGTGALKLRVGYEDRNGRPDLVENDVIIDLGAENFYGNTGIQKGILLTRYANFLKNWILDERAGQLKGEPVVPAVNPETGIPLPEDRPQLGQWERQSVPLSVSQEYRAMFGEFLAYFEAEMAALEDEDLEQEMDVLNKLSAFGG